MCLLGTGLWLDLRYCCLQLSQELLHGKQRHTQHCASWVLSNKPSKCEVNLMNGGRENRRTDGQTDRPK